MPPFNHSPSKKSTCLCAFFSLKTAVAVATSMAWRLLSLDPVNSTRHSRRNYIGTAQGKKQRTGAAAGKREGPARLFVVREQRDPRVAPVGKPVDLDLARDEPCGHDLLVRVERDLQHLAVKPEFGRVRLVLWQLVLRTSNRQNCGGWWWLGGGPLPRASTRRCCQPCGAGDVTYGSITPKSSCRL